MFTADLCWSWCSCSFGRCVPDTDSVRANECSELVQFQWVYKICSLLTPNCNAMCFLFACWSTRINLALAFLACSIQALPIWKMALPKCVLMNGAVRWHKSDLHFNCSYDNAHTFYIKIHFWRKRSFFRWHAIFLSFGAHFEHPTHTQWQSMADLVTQSRERMSCNSFASFRPLCHLVSSTNAIDLPFDQCNYFRC